MPHGCRGKTRARGRRRREHTAGASVDTRAIAGTGGSRITAESVRRVLHRSAATGIRTEPRRTGASRPAVAHHGRRAGNERGPSRAGALGAGGGYRRRGRSWPRRAREVYAAVAAGAVRRGAGRTRRLGRGRGRRGGRRTAAGAGRDVRDLRVGAERGGVRVVRASGGQNGLAATTKSGAKKWYERGGWTGARYAREGVPGRTLREGRAPRCESVATQIRESSSRAFQFLHPVTSSSPRNAQDAGVVIPFRTLKSKHDFSMSQGPMCAVLAAVSRGARCARARSRGASGTATVDAVEETVAAVLGRVR